MKRVHRAKQTNVMDSQQPTAAAAAASPRPSAASKGHRGFMWVLVKGVEFPPTAASSLVALVLLKREKEKERSWKTLIRGGKLKHDALQLSPGSAGILNEGKSKEWSQPEGMDAAGFVCDGRFNPFLYHVLRERIDVLAWLTDWLDVNGLDGSLRDGRMDGAHGKRRVCVCCWYGTCCIALQGYNSLPWLA